MAKNDPLDAYQRFTSSGGSPSQSQPSSSTVQSGGLLTEPVFSNDNPYEPTEEDEERKRLERIKELAPSIEANQQFLDPDEITDLEKAVQNKDLETIEQLERDLHGRANPSNLQKVGNFAHDVATGLGEVPAKVDESVRAMTGIGDINDRANVITEAGKERRAEIAEQEESGELSADEAQRLRAADFNRQVAELGALNAENEWAGTKGKDRFRIAAGVAGEGALDIGLLLTTAGTANVAKSAGKQGAKETIKLFTKRGIQASAEGAGVGFGVAMQGEDFTLDEAYKSVLIGAGAGFGFSTAAGIFGRTAGKQIVKGTKKAVGTTKESISKSLSESLDKSLDAERGRYELGKLDRAKVRIAKQINKYADLDRLDHNYARAKGVDPKDLPATERTAHLADMVGNSDAQAGILLESKTSTGKSVGDVVRKYGHGSDEYKEFASYLNNKFDLEVRQKTNGRTKLRTDADDAELARAIEEYETFNPEAANDAKTLRETADTALDYLVETGAKSAKEVADIKAAYENYIPTSRVTPDDLARQQFGGQSIGSIGKSRTVQELKGNTDLPLENTLEPVYDYVKRAVREGNTSRLAKKILERGEQGVIKNAEVLVMAGNKAVRKATREDIGIINKGLNRLSGKLKLKNRDVRKLGTAIAKLEKEAYELRLKDGPKGMPDFVPSELSRLANMKGKSRNMRGFVKELIETDPRKLKSIRKMISNREPKLAKAIDEMMDLQQEIAATKLVKQDLKDVVANFGDDPVTGRQTISGLIDGEQFKMEVPPELAKTLQGLDEQKLNAVVRGFAATTQLFRAAWTGVLNPIFASKALLFYDTPMSVINSKAGAKTLGPKIAAQSVKSVISDDTFQKMIVDSGARRVGGSRLGVNFNITAESASASRGLLDKVKYAAKHPKSALDSLDVYGGVAANSTRTRVAMAHYKRALKQNMTPEEAAFEAAYAYNNIMPNYHRTSSLVRQIDAFLPYTAAGLAGTRSLGRAVKESPASALTKTVALGIAPAMGVAAYSMGSESGQEFYRDMRESGRDYILKNNLVIVLPGASKNDENGEWSGVIKIPIAPEFRGTNNAVWRSMATAFGDDPVQAQAMAWDFFDFATGDMRGLSSPVMDTAGILQGNSPYGGRLVNEDMELLPNEEQVWDSTSEAGKTFAKLTGQRISPIQADAILKQFGLAGDIVTSGTKTNEDRQGPVDTIAESAGDVLTGATGDTATNAFYDTYNPAQAKRSAVSRQVTELVKEGRFNEARRRAQEFNETLEGRFGRFQERFSDSEAYNSDWDDMIESLQISTTPSAFRLRRTQ